MLLLFTDCGRRRRDTNRNSSRRERTVTPKEPGKKFEEKRDTAFIIVPSEPDGQTVPTISANDDGTVIIPSIKKLKPVLHKENLPSPPEINFTKPTSIHTRKDYIDYYNITGDMKDLIVACDYDNGTVRNNTANLVSLSPGNFNLGQICDIFDFCYKNWSYVNDPLSRDYYAKASETLKNGLNGDCDDFAILLCSMILSIGGEARISFAYDASSGHAFAEVNIGKTDRREIERYLTARYAYTEMWHKEDGNGNWWLNLDWQGQYPGAKYWKYSNGTCFNIIRNEKYNL
jgi:hypothetical protein